MATIPTPGSELRHVRKTITFTGGAGAGAVGSVTVFTITGRVKIETSTCYVSTTLVTTTGTLDMGTAGNTNGIVDHTSFAVSAYIAGKFVSPGFGTITAEINSNFLSGTDISANVVLTIATAAISSGVLIFDFWYRPITDDGALAGDDIDQDSRTWTWATALSDIAAVPAITASALSGLNWLFALARNKRTQTATTETVYKDDGSTSLSTSTKSDDGTTFTRGKYS